MINSLNEWDPLQEVVVGSATGANWPSTDPVFALEYTRTKWKETPVPSGPVPHWIIDEANEDLDILAETLHNLDIIVHRPKEIDFVKTAGMYNYCPRDRILVAGSTMVDCAMMYPCRDQEIHALANVVNRAKTVITMPREQGLVFDAANLCRLGDTWIYLESASGNHAAYNWLQQHFPTVNIERCNFYAGVHLDSTIVPLREGLVMLNASRVTEKNCPRAFDEWDKIWIDNVHEQTFYQYPYASKWIAMNVLVVDPHTVIIDKHQKTLIDKLTQYNFTIIPLELRHSRTLGGGFHCTTLDIVRSI